MARLIGAQRMVLQAILDLPKDSAGYVRDAHIAQKTQIVIADVRDWIETLEGEDHVNVARTTGGLSASITAQGRLALGQFRPVQTPPASPIGFSGHQPVSEPPQHPATFPAVGAVGSVQGPLPSGGTSPTSPTIQSKTPVQVFYSYSHKDEALRHELEQALALLERQGHISGWYDRAIVAGQQWDDQISEHLESARIILLLVSSSFLASDYCYGKEMGRALEKHEAGEATVIPVIVRPCYWHEAPFAKLQGLPKDGKAVTSWANKDEAWTDVAKGILEASSGFLSVVPPEQPHAGQSMLRQAIRLFYSYSHKDEQLRDELEESLALLKRQGLMSGWHDRRIGAGDEWKGAIDKNLEAAQVILLLVSSSFLASDYCWDVETKRAVERHDQGEAKVIPVILRPCDWQGAPFGKELSKNNLNV